jgi:hypothetical protein
MTIPSNRAMQPTCWPAHNPVISVYDDAGNVIETHEHKGEFKERESPVTFAHSRCD